MSTADQALLSTAMTEVKLVHGTDLVLPGHRIVDCWFLLEGMVSIIAMTRAGSQVEVGVAGLEGAVDVATLLGSEHSPHRALVQISGRALRLKASVVRAAMQGSPSLSALLLAYAHSFSVQVAGTALANAQFPSSSAWRGGC